MSAARGGFSTTILTKNLMADAREQPSLREGLLTGIETAQNHTVHGGPEFRNFDRSHRLEGCRGVVKG